MLLRIVSWLLVILLGLVLIALLLTAIGLIADQTGEAQPAYSRGSACCSMTSRAGRVVASGHARRCNSSSMASSMGPSNTSMSREPQSAFSNLIWHSTAYFDTPRASAAGTGAAVFGDRIETGRNVDQSQLDSFQQVFNRFLGA